MLMFEPRERAGAPGSADLDADAQPGVFDLGAVLTPATVRPDSRRRTGL